MSLKNLCSTIITSKKDSIRSRLIFDQNELLWQFYPIITIVPMRQCLEFLRAIVLELVT